MVALVVYFGSLDDLLDVFFDLISGLAFGLLDVLLHLLLKNSVSGNMVKQLG